MATGLAGFTGTWHSSCLMPYKHFVQPCTTSFVCRFGTRDVVASARKGIFVLALLLHADEPSMQAAMGSAVLLVWAGGQAITQPYRYALPFIARLHVFSCGMFFFPVTFLILPTTTCCACHCRWSPLN